MPSKRAGSPWDSPRVPNTANRSLHCYPTTEGVTGLAPGYPEASVRPMVLGTHSWFVPKNLTTSLAARHQRERDATNS